MSQHVSKDSLARAIKNHDARLHEIEVCRVCRSIRTRGLTFGFHKTRQIFNKNTSDQDYLKFKPHLFWAASKQLFI